MRTSIEIIIYYIAGAYAINKYILKIAEASSPDSWKQPATSRRSFFL